MGDRRRGAGDVKWMGSIYGELGFKGDVIGTRGPLNEM
jgi:hypothetical protein